MNYKYENKYYNKYPRSSFIKTIVYCILKQCSELSAGTTGRRDSQI